jgi:hypothetical protein
VLRSLIVATVAAGTIGIAAAPTASAAPAPSKTLVTTCKTLAPVVGNFGRGFVYPDVAKYSVGDLLVNAESVFGAQDNVKAGEKLTNKALTAQYVNLLKKINGQLSVAVKGKTPSNTLIVSTYKTWHKVFVKCEVIDGQTVGPGV